MFGIFMFGIPFFAQAYSPNGGTPPSPPANLQWGIYRFELRPRQEEAI